MSADIATELRSPTPPLDRSFGVTHPSPGSANPSRVIHRLTSRKALRSGALWGLVFGIYVASQVQAYVSAYKTQAERNALAKSFTSSGGLNALVGPVHQLNTVAGYTEWKSVGILTVLGAIWALLLSTKLLRGEEDAGRWELLLAGQTTRRGAAIQAMVGLGRRRARPLCHHGRGDGSRWSYLHCSLHSRVLHLFRLGSYLGRSHVHGRRCTFQSDGGKPSPGSRLLRRSCSGSSLHCGCWPTPTGAFAGCTGPPPLAGFNSCNPSPIPILRCSRLPSA